MAGGRSENDSGAAEDGAPSHEGHYRNRLYASRGARVFQSSERRARAKDHDGKNRTVHCRSCRSLYAGHADGHVAVAFPVNTNWLQNAFADLAKGKSTER